MTTEILDIVDTAVKIGLGALISGLSTYYVAKHNHAADAKKQFLNRKLGIIEAVTGHFDEFSASLSTLISAIDGVRRNYPEKESFDLANKKDAELWEFIRDNDEKFCDARNHSTFAASKLYLLELHEAAGWVTCLNKLGNEIRTAVLFEDKLPSSQQLEQWRAEFSDIKKKFFRAVSAHYKA